MSFNSKDFKGFTFRSGPVKNKVKQNSTFWDTNSDDVDVDEFLGIDTTVKKGKDLVALAGYKRAIGNFVNIVTEDNIPVVFNSKDESYTAVSYTHLRAHETRHDLVCRLLLEKKKIH